MSLSGKNKQQKTTARRQNNLRYLVLVECMNFLLLSGTNHLQHLWRGVSFRLDVPLTRRVCLHRAFSVWCGTVWVSAPGAVGFQQNMQRWRCGRGSADCGEPSPEEHYDYSFSIKPEHLPPLNLTNCPKPQKKNPDLIYTQATPKTTLLNCIYNKRQEHTISLTKYLHSLTHSFSVTHWVQNQF